ncbi:MAG TPA: hypothetical protein VMT89_07170 [Candidatus Acidoferrales bacterium]|nr:hypothetical protein [Candidatus Acidoferrales bacterium]
MASSWPTLNTLRISKLFIATRKEPHCCYEIKKQLNLPEESVRSQLRIMAENHWLDAERTERRGKAPPQVFYRLTGVGLSAALSMLREVQMPETELSS